MIFHRVYRCDPKTRIILLDHELNQFYLSRGLGTHLVWGGGHGHKMSQNVTGRFGACAGESVVL